MAYNSRVYYTGTGSEQNLSVTFPYLDISHIHVYFDGTLQEDDSWSWLNSSTITLTATSGAEVEIRRSTPLDPLVTFTNASLLNEDDQNTAALQSLYLIQEGADVSVLIEETISVIGDTAIAFSMDNGEIVIGTGTKALLVIPFDCDIVGAYLLAGVAGDMQVDVWVCPYVDFPPTVADSVVASAPLVLSDEDKYLDTTLTGWTIRIAAGSVVTINVDSCTTITKASVVLKVTRVQV
jgi:hypothetical protein